QFRLSQWNFAMDDAQKNVVQSFLQSPENGRHLLVFGAKGCGKTSLAVAIATELSFQHYPCTYTTGIKLYSRFFEIRREEADVNGLLWDWWSCRTLVIDDINPGQPVKQDLVSPADFLRFVDNYESNPLNRHALKNANVIWVLGSEAQTTNTLDGWKDMLQTIGVPPENIFALHLSGQS
ncbi:MAG TPA: ATP-binding protein, partial [Flavisolibacter sp.]|nr:ATP-binding protein [Flavisolibacter sp.]